MHMATPSLGSGVQGSGETKGQMGLSRAPLQLVAEAAFGSHVTPLTLTYGVGVQEHGKVKKQC